MPDITINLWTLVLGAASGVAAVAGSRFGNRFIMGALIGSATAVVLTIARGYV